MAMSQGTLSYEVFAGRVIKALRVNIANAELFNEHQIADIFERAQDSLIELDQNDIDISPEVFAARLLQSTAVNAGFNAVWRGRQ